VAQTTTDPDGLPTPQRYWAAATIWLALTLSVLDGSIANVALPTIAADLNAPAADSVWVVNAYQLAIVVSLLPMAAIGEMVGFRRVFQLGIIVFTLGSLGCTFAHSLPMLAFARAIQGFGAAGIMSQNGALVRFTYPSKMLGRGLGLNALVASAGAALGPTVAAGILAVAFRGQHSDRDRRLSAGKKISSGQPEIRLVRSRGHTAERVHVRLRVHRH